jgi:hypothetical protein
VESDDESHTTNELVMWIKSLQMRIRMMQGKNNGLKEENDKLKANAERAASQMLGPAQKMQCERDAQTNRWINALVAEKISSFKKFIMSQNNLDEFNKESSLGMVIMNRMKIDGLD